MRLEGTLDAFSLPDIFQLLSFTKKTGALHLRRPLTGGAVQHGVVHVRGGAVTGARADVTRQELARRLLGTGQVDDEALASAAEQLADEPGAGLARLLAERADLAADVAVGVAREQITDAVFDLLRWPDGEFAFVVDEADVDDLGAELPVEDLVAEGRRRLEAWPALAEQVPAADAVLRLNPAPAEAPVASVEEWALLALVDGRRTVGELVALAGRGEYAVVSSLASLVGRKLLVVGAPGDDRLLRRHHLLSALEGVPVAVEEPAAAAPVAVAEPAPAPAPTPEPAPAPQAAAPVVPAPAAPRAPVIPERPEPFTPARRPDHPEDVPALVRASAGDGATVTSLAGHGSVNGATAMQPAPQPAGVVERDPSVNKSLLLRLIAGVRGL
ncbi:MAG TPA: DUF4388 domain-containing protein [Mycobacteriales bacterium]|nr:DUF4388 domain-containing protein [Mycobacteriales bacterium]